MQGGCEGGGEETRSPCGCFFYLLDNTKTRKKRNTRSANQSFEYPFSGLLNISLHMYIYPLSIVVYPKISSFTLLCYLVFGIFDSLKINK